ncbi:MAG: flagellar basal body P-ring protein FlgI [Fimbriimonadales bacterium]|jgi:flagellar P-ring protein precursor FlgI|nr:flagellar basal body P-ring protein FlgI [Fimbriimonadaceae bacterium]MCX6342229.1 flagellar basal body P-ring protein FlgI [Fimbriimonadales bacterium]
MKKLLVLLFVALTAYNFAQQNPPAKPDLKRDQEIKDEMARRMQNMKRAELNGVAVRIKDVARFRGVRSNKLMGVGVVVGLQGTGDSRKNAQVSQAIQNYMKSMNFDIDVSRMDARNGALVIVSGDLPPFATNGQLMDVTVSTFGDAQSLRGGQLLRTELYAIGDSDTVYGIAEGAVSVGGFGASAGGNQQQVGFLTAGRVAGGGMVEKGAPTKLVYDNRMFIELYEVDLTTATRVQEAINKRNPEFEAVAESGSTISVSLPKGMNPIVAMAKLEEITVMVDNAAVVIVNEKTGSIAIGGNVKIAPVAIALGSISVNIVEEVSVSQPNPFSRNGDTAVVANQRVSADQGPADVAVVAPNSTIADLARIFQELRLKPNDIINILQLLKQQGALKARLIFQ